MSFTRYYLREYRAFAADLKELSIKLTELYQDLSPGMESTAETLAKTLGCPSGESVFYVHDVIKRLVAHGEVWVLPQTDGTVGLIENVVVSRHYRRMGFAKRLMLDLHEIARRGGADSVLLTSRPYRTEAHLLYHRLGYQKYDTHNFHLTLPKAQQ